MRPEKMASLERPSMSPLVGNDLAALDDECCLGLEFWMDQGAVGLTRQGVLAETKKMTTHENFIRQG